MNESAKRRQDLLTQMRNSRELHNLPPVHPDYRSAYHHLNNTKPDHQTHNSSFLFRFTIAIICFICYVWVDTSDIHTTKVSSDKIVTQIETNINFDEIQEVWKEL